MKKIVLVATVSLITSGLVFSQSYGIKGGINFAGIKVDNGSDPDGKVGAHFGGFIKKGLQNDWSLQGEALFSFQGWEDQNVTYLNIPVLAVYNVDNNLSFHAGPQLGILLGGDNDASDFLKTADVSIVFGGEYYFQSNVYGGARYNLGVSNINDFNEGADLFNRVFQIYVGYRVK
ncbi:MAG: porin family protein [Bacteroidota bacterium]